MKSAAFQATYSDWKLIRSRKVVQIVMEVPLEASGDAYEVLGGMPNPASEIWCAIARLRKEGDASGRDLRPIKESETAPASDQPSPARARKSWNEMDYAQQAGVLCASKKFQRFVGERLGAMPSEENAINYIYNFCGVGSRADILPNTPSENRWRVIVSAYRAWENAPACGAA